MTPGHKVLGFGPQKVVVLPGWFGDETLLDPLEPYLDLESRTYAVLAYRGYGASRNCAGRYTLDEISEDALALADGLGWDHFAVVGHSMGGKAAQAVMLAAPNRVTSIVAITPVPAGKVAFDDQGWALFTGAAADVDKRAAIINASTGDRLTPRFAQTLAAKSWTSSLTEAVAAYFLAWATSDISASVTGVATPLLAIVGAHDPQLTEEVMRATYLADYVNGSVLTIADAGHYPIEETTVLLATAMEAFLA